MIARGKWQGLLCVVRFNWPLYLVASLVVGVAIVGCAFAPSFVLRGVCLIALAGAAYFLIGSLAVSHLVYDRSDLYRWGWIERALRGTSGRRFIFCHAGFDDASALLREHLGPGEWRILDHFNEREMTEASIHRARRAFPPSRGTIAAPYDRWPVETNSADVVFGFLAIHELRSEEERRAWFAEAHRALRANGRVVLVEHLRDLANALAFGPGFLHFHSRASWGLAWKRANLRSIDEFRITPWIRAMVLGKR